MNKKSQPLTAELFHQMDAYWRAANFLSVGQIYLRQSAAAPAHAGAH